MKLKRFSLILAILLAFSFCPNVLAVENTKNEEPKIYGTSAITIDMKTGEIIYAKDIDGKNYEKIHNTKGMYPASITKLMTALVFSQNKDKMKLNNLKYTEKAYIQPEYSLKINFPALNLKPGDVVSANDAMKSLLLFSANDIAYVIAGNVGQTKKYNENTNQAVDNFINMMNKEAQKLNMKNTHFVTANGLHNVNHYTTSYDLSLLGRAALNNKWIAQTMKLQKATVKINGRNVPLENRNKLVGKYVDGALCIGGKTGYTSKAGRCLIAMFDKNGRKILGVVMNSAFDAKDSFVFNDMKKIISWSYKQKKVPYLKKDTVISTKTIKYKPFKFFGPEKSLKVPVVLKENVDIYNNYINKSEIKSKIDIKDLTMKNIKHEKPIGKLIVSERQISNSYNLYANVSKTKIFKNNILIYLGFIACLLLIGFIIFEIIKKINDFRYNRRRNRRWFH